MRAGTTDVWCGGWNVYEEEEAPSETEIRNIFWETEGWRFIGEGTPLSGQQLLF